jgi:aldose 1-epimerase
VPFSNRIAKAELQWQGTNHPLVKMGTTEDHAMHGVAWQRPWVVLEASDDFAMLSYEHTADNAWPFAFDVSQTFKLSADTLSLTLSITNQAKTSAPVGLGWHPYFAKRPQSHIIFDATARWEMGADKLPTHLKSSQGMDADCLSLDSDHCFEGWSGVVHLRDEKLHTCVESNLSRIVVYTNSTKDFVAIEPVSHANNAINLGSKNAEELARLGVRILQSGETFNAQMSIRIKRI